ncbi:MAG TPA: prepilin-type N-terminal cleavage/methylation domain-containing protein [Verrucomicrobiae bacterium]|nr:prepilin-type N-terminal cleavage/methylation domain-containing protein [Verrucomicrobiae bacterium]
MRFNKREFKGRTRETHAQSQNSHAAFTLPELLVVLAILIILIGMIMPPVHHQRPAAYRIKCVNNLKNVGLAFRIYATDNNDRYPWELPDSNDATNRNRILYSADPTTYILAVTNELSIPKIVKCPADIRTEATNWTQFTRENMSYFISPDSTETFPQSFLAGDRSITNKNGRLPPGLHDLSTTDVAAVGWDETIHKNQGNACMGDGSVQQLSAARLREQLRNTGRTNKSIKLSVP